MHFKIKTELSGLQHHLVNNEKAIRSFHYSMREFSLSNLMVGYVQHGVEVRFQSCIFVAVSLLHNFCYILNERNTLSLFLCSGSSR